MASEDLYRILTGAFQAGRSGLQRYQQLEQQKRAENMQKALIMLRIKQMQADEERQARADIAKMKEEKLKRERPLLQPPGTPLISPTGKLIRKAPPFRPTTPKASPKKTFKDRALDELPALLDKDEKTLTTAERVNKKAYIKELGISTGKEKQEVSWFNSARNTVRDFYGAQTTMGFVLNPEMAAEYALVINTISKYKEKDPLEAATLAMAEVKNRKLPKGQKISPEDIYRQILERQRAATQPIPRVPIQPSRTPQTFEDVMRELNISVPGGGADHPVYRTTAPIQGQEKSLLDTIQIPPKLKKAIEENKMGQFEIRKPKYRTLKTFKELFGRLCQKQKISIN